MLVPRAQADRPSSALPTPLTSDDKGEHRGSEASGGESDEVRADTEDRVSACVVRAARASLTLLPATCQGEAEEDEADAQARCGHVLRINSGAIGARSLAHPAAADPHLLNRPSTQDDEEDEEAEASAQEPAPAPPSQAQKQQEEQERQLSKKELKKKELEDLDAVFAELGINVEVRAEKPAQGRGSRPAASARRDVIAHAPRGVSSCPRRRRRAKKTRSFPRSSGADLVT